MQGLITKERNNLDRAAASFAKYPKETDGLREGANLSEVVRNVKPDVLLGLSGVGGIFNEEVLKAMRESDSPRPAIFAMSNPTPNGNGKVGHVNRANNMYLFPGIGLGALLSGARMITVDMLQAAAECLASYITDDEIQRGILYPSDDEIQRGIL